MVSFPGYTIKSPIGETGDFRIFLAVQNGADHSGSVLIKIPFALRPPVAVVRRLERELEMAGELDPKRIARPLRLLRRDGKVALVLENGICRMLSEELSKPMEIRRFLSLAIQAAAALAEIHDHDLIHKDLKPQHMLLNEDGHLLRISGFGIATRAPRETQPVQAPHLLEGTLAYMSPEQTGRMNRALDYRTDFYSLGVVFYQMLTGTLPFQAADPLEWIHCHIARFPKSPRELVPAIPETLSDLAMKLLAKVAEERYQSATGLQRDLEICAAQWETSGRIEPFLLGQADISDRFQIPQKLYGREIEVAKLLSAFNRVAGGGAPELVLVSGYAGIGKSSLVHELQKPVVSRRGYFISGKFDQVKRDIPYSTILAAFRQLIHQILSQSEERIEVWRKQLEAALGDNGQLIVDLLPEVERLIGRQPPVAGLPITQAQHRLHRVFQSFLGVFCREEHPLTLFLDDMQWIDSASLQLLTYWMTVPGIRHFLLVGAYRDNEVDPSHPLMMAVENIRRNEVPIRQIVLGPLSRSNMNRFVADALHCDLKRAAPLAKLVHEKTGSNPFFVNQFLTALVNEKLITFDRGSALWQWDVERIHAHGYTDNVIDFMIRKLGRLPAATQRVMQFAACIGHEGSIPTLALICGETVAGTEQHLWSAVCEGLIIQSGDRYQFLHDRVQQAAYALIPPERRRQIHLQIARLLLSRAAQTKDGVADGIFEIVNQFNFGAGQITADAERLDAARLNLIAGTRAQVSTAYQSALTYYETGLALLGSDPWTPDPEPAYSLGFGRAQCEYITGRSDQALGHLEELLPHALTDLQRAEIYRTGVEIYTLKTELAKAVELALTGLKLFGIEMSPHPTRSQVLDDYDQVWRALGDRPIEDLANLPVMTDSGMRAAMQILESLYTGALCTDENLFLSWSSHMVNLSLRYGNCEASVTGYSYLGLALGSLFGRYKEGYLFGKLGHDLVEKHGITAYQGKVNFIFGDCIAYWHRHLRNNIEALRVAFTAALDTADLATASYCCNHRLIDLFVLGEPLDAVHREAEALLEFTHKTQMDASTQTIVGIDRAVQNLRGLTASFSTFSDASFDEAEYERFMDRYGQPIVVCWYYIMKLQARFMSGDFDVAIAAAAKAAPILWASMGHTQESEYWYYLPLAIAARYRGLSAEGQRDALQTLRVHQRKLREWAETCPANFLNKSALLDAEIARLTGEPMEETAALYERAIQSAQENGFVQNEAIADELAARYYQERGMGTASRGFLREARSCYQRWGAEGKVRDLDRRHLWLGENRAAEYATIAAPFEKLDMMTVSKAQQAISGELLIERLVETLLRIVLENAGAQKAYLFVEPDGEVFSVVHSTAEGGIIVFRRTPLAEAEGMASSMVNYVKRTLETVILADASVNCGDFVADEYLQKAKPKSVLCMPVVRQTKLNGVLYLENNLAANAFTPDRRAVLEVLASQAAISLETALLYSDLQRAKDEQQEQADMLRRILDSLGEGVVVVNEKAEMLLSNPMAGVIIGNDVLPVSADQWTQRFGFYLPDRSTPYPFDDLPLIKAVRGKPSDDVEIFIRNPARPDGRWLTVNARPLVEKGGKVRGAVAVFSDITTRIEAVRGEREAKESAEAANRTKDQFLAMLSHELRTPLTPVLNGINELEDAADTESNAVLQIMRRNLLLEMRIIDDLLDITHIAKGKLAITPEPVDAVKCIRDALETCRPDMGHRNVSLRLEATEHSINADAGRIQQVIRNLLQNAIRFTDPGGSIELRAYNPEPGRFRIACTDNGVGIDPGDIGRIFNPFEQSDRVVKRGYGGLGLGLAISKALVEAHRGSITVRSAGRGAGATFEVTLPTIPALKITRTAPAAPLQVATGPMAAEGKMEGAPLRILLIEDHGDTRRTLERLLRRSGYEVDSVGDCRGALLWAREGTYDLIICDIGLPDGNGYDLLHALHELQPCPAISLSGFGMAADFERSRSAGFVEHLVKPVEFKHLKDVIEHWANASAIG